MEEEILVRAREARGRAYAPYSGYKVGAAVEDENGNVYTGCNIENGSYGASMCGERTAIFKAVSEGAGKIKRMAVVAEGSMPYPCGMCRQVMSEFFDSDTEIILECGGRVERYRFEELMPYMFKLQEKGKAEK